MTEPIPPAEETFWKSVFWTAATHSVQGLWMAALFYSYLCSLLQFGCLGFWYFVTGSDKLVWEHVAEEMYPPTLLLLCSSLSAWSDSLFRSVWFTARLLHVTTLRSVSVLCTSKNILFFFKRNFHTVLDYFTFLTTVYITYSYAFLRLFYIFITSISNIPETKQCFHTTHSEVCVSFNGSN